MGKKGDMGDRGVKISGKWCYSLDQSVPQMRFLEVFAGYANGEPK